MNELFPIGLAGLTTWILVRPLGTRKSRSTWLVTAYFDGLHQYAVSLQPRSYGIETVDEVNSIVKENQLPQSCAETS